MSADLYDQTKDYDPTKDLRLKFGLGRSPRVAIPITKSDTLDVTNASGDNAACYAKGMYVGVSGDIALVMAGDQSAAGAGTPVTLKAVPVGKLDVAFRRVMSTNTAATNMVGLYDQ